MNCENHPPEAGETTDTGVEATSPGAAITVTAAQNKTFVSDMEKQATRKSNAVPCDGEIEAEGAVAKETIEIRGAVTKSSGNKEVIAREDRAETKSGSVEDHWPGSQSKRAAGSNE